MGAATGRELGCWEDGCGGGGGGGRKVEGRELVGIEGGLRLVMLEEEEEEGLRAGDCWAEEAAGEMDEEEERGFLRGRLEVGSRSGGEPMEDEGAAEGGREAPATAAEVEDNSKKAATSAGIATLASLDFWMISKALFIRIRAFSGSVSLVERKGRSQERRVRAEERESSTGRREAQTDLVPSFLPLRCCSTTHSTPALMHLTQ